MVDFAFGSVEFDEFLPCEDTQEPARQTCLGAWDVIQNWKY